MSFPLIHQPDAMDCGPACLAMIAKHYGKEYNIDNLRANSYIGRDGVSLLETTTEFYEKEGDTAPSKNLNGRLRKRRMQPDNGNRIKKINPKPVFNYFSLV